MGPNIIWHSEGMVSLDAENHQSDGETLQSIKKTRLYRQLVDSFGEEEANEIIQGSPKVKHDCNIPE